MKFPGIKWLVIVTMIPGKVTKQLYLESISSPMKDKKIISSSQCGLPPCCTTEPSQAPGHPIGVFVAAGRSMGIMKPKGKEREQVRTTCVKGFSNKTPGHTNRSALSFVLLPLPTP